MWRPTGRCLPPHAIRYGYKLTYKSTVGTGVPDCPSYASRRVVWIRHHLKRRRFLRSYLAHLPWLNLYFCCYATKIKEKYNVWLADIHGSKSVRKTPRLYAILYFQSTHFHFLKKMKIFHIPLAEYFIREAYFTFSKKIFHIRRSRIFLFYLCLISFTISEIVASRIGSSTI